MADRTKKRGRGRPPGPLGKGVQCSVMVPQQLHDAIIEDVGPDGPSNFSQAVVTRLKRGKPRGRAL